MILRKSIIILALLAAAYVTTGCGVIQSMRENCNGSDICEYFLGRDRTATDAEQDRALQAHIDSTATVLNALIQSALTLEAQYGQSEAAISALQAQINLQQLTLAQLSTGLRVIDLIDPCGDGPGYDEVLVRMSNGDLVAYFEQGSNRFLTVLTRNAYYRTTDAQGCNFYLGAAGTVSW